MDNTVIDLTKPRYKQIANYPSSHRKEEYVFVCDELDEEFFKKYPAIYKRMEWWEERNENEMPEYAKVENIVFPVKKWDLKNEQGWICNSNGHWHHRAAIKPSTLEEYEAFINNQKSPQ